MCGIFGWTEPILNESEIRLMLDNVSRRGRDGWGFWIDGYEVRGMDQVPESIIFRLYHARSVLGNFRATPTTEAESKVSNLQPYGGIVHNGTIANDKELDIDKEGYEIDSMVLQNLFKDADGLITFRNCLSKVVGSYALAFFKKSDLYIGLNYKPLYYHRSDSSNGLIFASQEYMIPREESVPFKPYMAYAVNQNRIYSLPLPRRQSRRVLLSASSGLDSTTVAYMLRKQGYEVTLVHFLYGCLAEEREKERIKMIATHGGFEHIYLEMPKGVMKGSLLENHFLAEGIAGAEYAHDWISARNLLMLSMLTALAESADYGYIAIGNNLEEAGAYPDNEEEFGNMFNKILPYSTQNGIAVELLQPAARLMKHEIVKIGLDLEVPFELTWSCYSNEETHCGHCGPCFMRKTAFERNKRKDPVFVF